MWMIRRLKSDGSEVYYKGSPYIREGPAEASFTTDPNKASPFDSEAEGLAFAINSRMVFCFGRDNIQVVKHIGQ